jgi:hypothetical protein
MSAGLKAFLQLSNTSLNRHEHFSRLNASIAENKNPSVFAELLPQSFRICFQLLIALLQLFSPLAQLLTGRGKDPLSPTLKHGQSHGQERQRCPQWLYSGEYSDEICMLRIILRGLDQRSIQGWWRVE